MAVNEKYAQGPLPSVRSVVRPRNGEKRTSRLANTTTLDKNFPKTVRGLRGVTPRRTI